MGSAAFPQPCVNWFTQGLRIETYTAARGGHLLRLRDAAMSLFVSRIDAQKNHTRTLSHALPETRPRARLGILQVLRLWRARHRHRQELVQMSTRDLRDAGVPRDLVEHEARKWPWQKWNSQWHGLDEVLLRRIADRR